MDPSWIEHIKQLGIPVSLLLLLIWKGWPLLVKQLEKAQAEREASDRRQEEQAKLFTEALQAQREADAKRSEDIGKIFMDALRSQQVFATESHKELMQEIRGGRVRRRKA